MALVIHKLKSARIPHLYISHNAPYLPPKVCISIVFNFVWDGCNTKEKWKQRLAKFGGGGGKLCASSEIRKWRIGTKFPPHSFLSWQRPAVHTSLDRWMEDKRKFSEV